MKCDPNNCCLPRSFDVKVTLQYGDYRGTVIYQVAGILSPYQALTVFVPEYDQIEASNSNCEYLERTDEADDWYFQAALKNEAGETYRIQDKCKNLGNYIVALEIVRCEEVY